MRVCITAPPFRAASLKCRRRVTICHSKATLFSDHDPPKLIQKSSEFSDEEEIFLCPSEFSRCYFKMLILYIAMQ